jgi:hypothetical protein
VSGLTMKSPYCVSCTVINGCVLCGHRVQLHGDLLLGHVYGNADVALEEWAVSSASTSKYMPYPLQGLSWWLKDPLPAVTYWLWKKIQKHVRWHTRIVRVSLSQVLTPVAAPETEHLVTRRVIYFSIILQPVNMQRLCLLLSSKAFRICQMCTDLLLILLHFVYLAFNCWESAFYSVTILVLYFFLVYI